MTNWHNRFLYASAIGWCTIVCLLGAADARADKAVSCLVGIGVDFTEGNLGSSRVEFLQLTKSLTVQLGKAVGAELAFADHAEFRHLVYRVADSDGRWNCLGGGAVKLNDEVQNILKHQRFTFPTTLGIESPVDEVANAHVRDTGFLIRVPILQKAASLGEVQDYFDTVSYDSFQGCWSEAKTNFADRTITKKLTNLIRKSNTYLGIPILYARGVTSESGTKIYLLFHSLCSYKISYSESFLELLYPSKTRGSNRTQIMSVNAVVPGQIIMDQ